MPYFFHKVKLILNLCLKSSTLIIKKKEKPTRIYCERWNVVVSIYRVHN